MTILKFKKYIFYTFLLCLGLPSLAWGADVIEKFPDFPPAAINCDSYSFEEFDSYEGTEPAGAYKRDSCFDNYCVMYAQQIYYSKKIFQECSDKEKDLLNKGSSDFYSKEAEILETCRLLDEKYEERDRVAAEDATCFPRTIDPYTGYCEGSTVPERVAQINEKINILLKKEKELRQSNEKNIDVIFDILSNCEREKKKPKNPLDLLNYLDSGGSQTDPPEDPSSGQSSSWLGDMASTFFSWDSTSWDDMQQQAVDYWQAKSQATDGPLQYFYDLMAGLAGAGSRANLILLAMTLIPFASLSKLFAMGNLGPKLTLDIINSQLSNITVIFKNLPSGLSGVAGIGNGVNYTQAGTVAIKQALAGNPIASVITRHEIAHLLGASEIGAWKITSQAFSALSLGDKFRSLGTLAGANTAFAWALDKTLPTLNRTILQLGYLPNLISQKLTWNIWKGY